MAEGEGRPVLAGLAALVGVGLVVGLLISGAALAGTSVLGLNGDSGSGEATTAESMYLPKPAPTESASGPLFTLAPDTSSPDKAKSSTPGVQTEKPKAPKKKITLSASTTSATQMGEFDLSGVYPGGEGAILRVERFTDGSWREFPVTTSVSNETFSVPVRTSQLGKNRFRMRDTDTGKVSNEVGVQIG